MPQRTVRHLKNGNADGERLALQIMPFIKHHHLDPAPTLELQSCRPSFEIWPYVSRQPYGVSSGGGCAMCKSPRQSMAYPLGIVMAPCEYGTE